MSSSCRYCKGTGKIQLLTSIADCLDCQTIQTPLNDNLIDGLVALGHVSTNFDAHRFDQIRVSVQKAMDQTLDRLNFAPVLCNNVGMTLTTSQTLNMNVCSIFDYKSVQQRQDAADHIKRCELELSRQSGCDSLRCLSRGGGQLSYRFQRFDWNDMILSLNANDVKSITIGRDLYKVLMDDSAFDSSFYRMPNMPPGHNIPVGTLNLYGNSLMTVVYYDELGLLTEPNQAMVMSKGAYDFVETGVKIATDGYGMIRLCKTYTITIIPAKLGLIEHIP